MMEQLKQICNKYKIHFLFVDDENMLDQYMIYDSDKKRMLINKNIHDVAIRLTIEFLIYLEEGVVI